MADEYTVTNDTPEGFDEVDHALQLYKKREKLFTTPMNVLKDCDKHFKHVTRKYKHMSDNYVKAIVENPFSRHYKLGQTYVDSVAYWRTRRNLATRVSILRYIKEPKGYMYYLMNTQQTALAVIKSHVFERFIERELKLPKWEAVDLPKDEVMFDVVRRIEKAQQDPMYFPVPLLDTESGSIYLPIDGGYLVGKAGFYADEVGGKASRIVTFYKTFLSHNEISESRMELLLDLFQKRKQLIKEKEELENE